MINDLREIVDEQVQYHELLRQMTKRDLLLRYKQAVMGFAWAIFTPLVNTAVFSVIFTRVVQLDVGMAYPLYAFTGLLAWNFFASSLRSATNSLTSNTSLVTKVYFPREIFPMSAVAVSFVDACVASSLLAGMMIYYGVYPGGTIVVLPVVVLVHVMFTMACSFLLAMGNLFYRDVKYLSDVTIQLWMFATSVLYPASQVGGRTAMLMQLNPMTAIIDAYRDVLLLNRWPDPYAFVGVSAFSLIVLFLAWLSFHRAEFKFAEYI